MIVKARGLVVRETKFGESGMILTVLTHQFGKISVSANNIRSYKNKNSCGFLCYSDFVLRKGRDIYFLNQSDPIERFTNISSSVEKLSLATYLGQLVSDILPEEKEVNNQLSLLLNSFYILAKTQKPLLLIKAVFELRFMAESGYMPSLLACTNCGVLEFPMCFDVENGSLTCLHCIKEKKHPITKGVYEALRYIVSSPIKKIFSFEINEELIYNLAGVAEKFLLYHIDKKFKSLDFFKIFL